MTLAVSPTPTFARDIPVVLARIDRAASRHTRHPRHLHPPLDLKYVQAGLTAMGISAPLVDGWLERFEPAAFAARLAAMKPQIVVLKAVSWCIEESLAVAHDLRAAGIDTVAVGQQVAHARQVVPAGWPEAWDFTLGGEPEEALPGILAAALAGAAWPPTAEVLVTHPESLPTPQFTPEELAAYPFPLPWRGPAARRWGYVLTAWGCPRPCTHCTSIVRKSVGRPLRTRSIASVLDEVDHLADAGAVAIAFEDDSLFVQRTRFLELASALVRHGSPLPWLANARPDELDAEVIEAARAAGARLIKVGIDSGSPRLIESIGKSRDGVSWVAASRTALTQLDAAGIGAVALFVVGLPGETSAEVQSSLDLALELPADYLQVQLYRPYPDAGLWAGLPAAQREAGTEYHYVAPIAQCGAMPGAELAAWPARFYRRFYLRPAQWARLLRLAGFGLPSLTTAWSATRYVMRGA